MLTRVVQHVKAKDWRLTSMSFHFLLTFHLCFFTSFLWFLACSLVFLLFPVRSFNIAVFYTCHIYRHSLIVSSKCTPYLYYVSEKIIRKDLSRLKSVHTLKHRSLFPCNPRVGCSLAAYFKTVVRAAKVNPGLNNKSSKT